MQKKTSKKKAEPELVKVKCPTKGCKGLYYRPTDQVGQKEQCAVCVKEVVLVPKK